MRVLIALTYYRPHISGVTVYAERLARGLARRGHEVTVLTSRFAPHLPEREQIDGVSVVRVPVLMKVSKGVIMPFFPAYAWKYVRENEVVNVHMPQFEAAFLIWLARLSGRAAVLTYHCDLRLPPGFFNRIVDASLVPLNRLAAHGAHAIVVNTEDYARSSRFLDRYRHKLHPISPPIELPPIDPFITAQLEQNWNLNGHVRIGFAARFAAEKGVEYLLRALPKVIERFPSTRVLFTGAYKDTVGEEAYWERLAPMLERYREHISLLELLPSSHMPSFFALCDVLAVTSLNSTESFGLVQAEAMMAGTPVVATDLPGVREPVRRTGMGRVVPPRDPDALASALVEVISARQRFVRSPELVRSCFNLEETLRCYEEVFDQVQADAKRAS